MRWSMRSINAFHRRPSRTTRSALPPHELAGLEQSMGRMESAGLRFMVDGLSVHREALERHLDEIGRHIATLKTMVSDNPEHAETIAGLQADFRALTERVRGSIAIKQADMRRGDESASIRRVRDGHGEPLVERMHARIQTMQGIEDGLLANANDPELPADGVVTGFAKVHGRSVAIVANDSTVKAGSWGVRTVEKMIRMLEQAGRHHLPVYYLIDSAGARITDQVQMFPGRRGAGRIFHNEVKMSGRVPQVCVLFGPSAAGGAYIPAFTDVVFMVEGNASMYLGSPRMAEVVIGEHLSLEETGGARMHATVSGCGDNLVDDDAAADVFFAVGEIDRYCPPAKQGHHDGADEQAAGTGGPRQKCSGR